MNRVWRRHLMFGLCVLLTAAPSWVRAQGPETAPVASQRVLLMLPDLDDDRDERAEATIAAHLYTSAHDSGVDLLIRRYDPASLELRGLFSRSAELLDAADGRGILWVELGDDPALYVLVRDSTQVYGRTIAGEVGEAVALESLANIAATAALAIAEGRAIVLESDPRAVSGPAPEPESAPEPEPEPPAMQIRQRTQLSVEIIEAKLVPKLEPRARLRVGYRGQSFAPGLPWLSAVELALGWRPVPRAHLELGYEASTPIVVEAYSLGLQLQLFRAPISLLGGYRFDLRRGWGVELAGRFSVEPTRRQTVASGEGLTGADPSWRVLVTGGLDLRGTKAISDDLGLWLGLGLIGVFVRSEYVLADMDQPLLSPAPLRFAASFGVAFDLIHH